MQLSHLQMFCEAVEQRSFSKAATQLQVTQSAVSQAVQLIEKHLGTTLIDRSKRPFALTEAGSIYFKGCVNTLCEYRSLEDRVRQLGKQVVGRLRVSAIYSVGLLEMTELIEAHQSEFPEVQIDCQYCHPSEVRERVLNGHSELGITSFPQTSADLNVITWQDQEMVVVVGPKHPFWGRETIQPQELNEEKFVAFNSLLKIRSHTDRWFKSVDVGVQILHEFDDVENVKRDVEFGTACALLPLPTIYQELKRNSLWAVKIQNVHWTRPLGILHHRQRSLSKAAETFLNRLLEHTTDPSQALRA